MIKQEGTEFGHADEIFSQFAQLTSISFIWIVTLEYQLRDFIHCRKIGDDTFSLILFEHFVLELFITVRGCLPLHSCLCSLLRCYPCRQHWSEAKRHGPLRMSVTSRKVCASTVRLCAQSKVPY